MKIHTFHSYEIVAERIERIGKYLNSAGGPMEFLFHPMKPSVFRGAETLSFEELFRNSKSCRESQSIPDDEFVLTLTDIPNRGNYFASLEPQNMRNGFVHAGEWDRYTTSEDSIPTAFTILNIVILGMMVEEHSQVKGVTHEVPIGCLNDFCKYKQDVRLKLRTADICVDCINRMVEKGISTLTIEQSLNLLETMRKDMKYSLHFHKNFKPSRIELTLNKGGNSVKLIDYDEKVVKLQPFEMTVYLFFLLHPEGIPLKQLKIAREELKKHYMTIALKPVSDYEEKIRNEIVKMARGRSGVVLQESIKSVVQRLIMSTPRPTTKQVESWFKDKELKAAIAGVIDKSREEVYNKELKRTMNGFLSVKEGKNKDGSIYKTVISKGSADVVISKINKKFQDAVGENFSKPYMIDGEKGERKRIAVDRSHVIDYKRLSRGVKKLKISKYEARPKPPADRS